MRPSRGFESWKCFLKVLWLLRHFDSIQDNKMLVPLPKRAKAIAYFSLYALCPQGRIGAKERRGRRRRIGREQRQGRAGATKVHGKRESEHRESAATRGRYDGYWRREEAEKKQQQDRMEQK